jgi:hypothetical protein
MRELATTHECERKNGDRIGICEFVNMREFRPLDGPVQHAKGARDFETEDGDPVNYVDDNTFQLVMTDEIVRKV